MRGPFVDPLFRHFYLRITDYNSIFFDWIRDYITENSVILEIGAGAGKKVPYDFAKQAQRVIGVDMDPRVLDNPNLDESLCIDFFENKFDDNTFDIIFANSVVEHIKYPQEFLTEIRRILKPSGYFFFKTPNMLHYATIIAKFTPYWFHKFYCSLYGRKYEDTFPTYYCMNSRRRIEKLSQILNFTYEIKTLERQPDYLFLDPITFLMGVSYERLVNKYKSLNRFRILLMVKVEFEK
jgi:SAM-dependent methyltransferase